MKEFIPILDDETTPEIYGVNDDDNMPELEDADDSSIRDAMADDGSIRDDDSIRDAMADDEDMPELTDDMPELEPNMERSIRIIYIFIFFQSF